MSTVPRPREPEAMSERNLLEGTFGKNGRPICRLGLASRGNTHLTPEDVHHAVARGINFLNWHGRPNGLSRAVAELGKEREKVMVCAQFDARRTSEAKSELAEMLRDLDTDYLDVLTFYYVESQSEWETIIGPGGAWDYCAAAKCDGIIHHLGLTSHQRPLAAQWIRSGHSDMLMLRYNAAHRGAERDVFPITDPLGIPVVAYTCLRWGALMRSTPDDPPRFEVPTAPDWYRFVLQCPSITVAVMAPNDRAELEENLSLLNSPSPMSAEEHQRMAEHGLRVREHAGYFP